ncbi:penicillin-binding protein PBP2B [Streptococcus pacificus]|uniref:Penicillin-binding protein 2 n=1 Tax=Streptococcus pacificus TaxID=2740577 RepID=A0ABS0ZH93_9STRE|nr:penicillin-binding protein PBP2B [Streptococcus pacificus]MBJ8325364.1 penicillin-binding protein 2 [Streptococcus pacificus]
MADNQRPTRKNRVKVGKVVAHRINLLFFIIVFLFTILILRLADMQLINKEFYTAKITALTTYKVTTSNPRGQIYDAKGVPLAKNNINEVVAYTRNYTSTAQEIRETAEKLSNYVTISDLKVSERDKRDYYLALTENYQEVYASLPDDQKYDDFGNKLAESVTYNNAVDAVSEDDIAYSDEELKVVSLFSQMNATPIFNTSFLKTDPISAKEIAVIASNQSDLPGVSVQSTWDRVVNENSLSDVIGTISTEQTGLPAEELDDYLKKGYSLNDRVGTSYLEKSYEDYLQGKRTTREIVVNKKGQVVSDNIETQGQQGNNLKLTVDLKFQEGVEDILKRYFDSELAQQNTQNSEGIYAVVLDVNTGGILSMAGYQHDIKTGEVKKNALGTITEVFTPGSVVKGATISAGFEHQVIAGNQVLPDQAIQLANSAPIKSWFTTAPLPITASQALEYSSNTYMVQVALKMLGQEYVPGMVLSTDGTEEAMTKLRESFAQYGLGVSTGIDLPGESLGFIPTEFDVANYLTESFGQFDNYTPMQLAQYALTVANGGNRLAPHLVEGIYQQESNGESGDLIESIQPKSLNTVAISPEEMAIIQDGFYQVVNSNSTLSTGRKIGQGANVSISAKTGTAESYVKDKDGKLVYTSNLNVVAYAPSDNPQIAISVVLPHETDLSGTVSHDITRDIVNLYHSLYPMN